MQVNAALRAWSVVRDCGCAWFSTQHPALSQVKKLSCNNCLVWSKVDSVVMDYNQLSPERLVSKFFLRTEPDL